MIFKRDIPDDYSGLKTAVYSADESNYFLSICGKERRFILDIETYKCMFCAVFTDYDTDNTIVFEISQRRNDLIAFAEFYRNNQVFCITFNGEDFDIPVCNWITSPSILPYFFDGCSYAETTYIIECIFKTSQIVISKEENFEEFKERIPTDMRFFRPFYGIDLYLFWSRLIRIGAKISLKSCAFMLNENVMEMPVKYNADYLTNRQIHQVIYYCVNDTLVTKKMAVELKMQINLRLKIYEKYNLKCLSWDIPKISRQLLIKKYLEKTFRFQETETYTRNWLNREITDKNKSKYYRDYNREFDKAMRNFKDQHKGKYTSNWSMKDVIPEVSFTHPTLQSFYNKLLMSGQTFKHEASLPNPNGTSLRISWGMGGIHSVNENEYYDSDLDYIIIDSDVERSVVTH